MHGYIHRADLAETLKNRLENNPAVALLGARQVGKSTLAEVLLKQFPGAVHLDLERPADINKLTDPEAFFTSVGQALICLDEIQRLPDIFPVLRGLINRNKRNAQFLLLDSASRDHIRQSAEGIENQQELFGHPVYGASWEGYVIENIVTQLPRWKASFFRTSNGAEMDLVLEKGSRRIAVEVKASTSPMVSKGFWTSIETIQPDATYIVAPVDSAYPIAKHVNVVPLPAFIESMAS